MQQQYLVRYEEGSVCCTLCGRQWDPDENIDISKPCPGDDCPSHDEGVEERLRRYTLETSVRKAAKSIGLSVIAFVKNGEWSLEIVDTGIRLVEIAGDLALFFLDPEAAEEDKSYDEIMVWQWGYNLEDIAATMVMEAAHYKVYMSTYGRWDIDVEENTPPSFETAKNMGSKP